MSASNIQKTIPDRAIASIAFACFAFLVRHIFAQLEEAPLQLGGHHFDFPDELYIPIMVSLQTGFRALAVTALIWCIWSWCKEWWLPASLATLSTVSALFDVFIVR